MIGRRKFMFQAGGLCMYKEIYYKVLTHMNMGVEKSYNLLFANSLKAWEVESRWCINRS